VDTEEKELWDSIARRTKRIQELADLENQAAPVKGLSADGRHWPEKKSHIDAIDRHLDALEELYATRT